MSNFQDHISFHKSFVISKITSSLLMETIPLVFFIFPSKKFINELRDILLNNGLIEDNINIIIEYLFDLDLININIPAGL